MFIPFEKISDDARVWVYLANRELSKNELETISANLRSFVDQWKAHGKDLRCSFKIAYNQFIIIAVDEQYNTASGCSIDESVNFLRQLEQHFHIDLFDRKKIPFLFEEVVQLIDSNKLKDEIESGIVRQETLTFNPVVRKKKDLEEVWIQSTGSSWLQRYFK
jgi:hypothetical protein